MGPRFTSNSRGKPITSARPGMRECCTADDFCGEEKEQYLYIYSLSFSAKWVLCHCHCHRSRIHFLSAVRAHLCTYLYIIDITAIYYKMERRGSFVTHEYGSPRYG
jgi:hypothetical protein